jgi:hypothetical protein
MALFTESLYVSKAKICFQSFFVLMTGWDREVQIGSNSILEELAKLVDFS